jgi:ArsR family metal-binding transcriptional regulator
MDRLDNKGWGIFDMFLMSGIILIAVLVVVISMNEITNFDDTKVVSNNEYSLETELKQAAKNYYNKTDDTSDVVSVNLLELQNYINKTTCTGYVVKSENYKPYIKCGVYETKGYDQDLD